MNKMNDMNDISDLFNGIVNVSLCNSDFISKNVVNFEIENISIICGRTLVTGFCQNEDGTLDHTPTTILVIDSNTWDPHMFNSPGCVIMQHRETFIPRHTRFIFGTLRQKFKFKNTRRFQIKINNAIIINGNDEKSTLVETFTVKVVKSLGNL